MPAYKEIQVPAEKVKEVYKKFYKELKELEQAAKDKEQQICELKESQVSEPQASLNQTVPTIDGYQGSSYAALIGIFVLISLIFVMFS